MKLKIIFALFCMLAGLVVRGEYLQEKFDKATYYAAMDSGDIDAINKEISVVTYLSFAGKDGYEGALLMRKAGLLVHPPEKLHFFKIGRIKLESALMNDKDNAEFHFLRFAIQEHAPNIVKYHNDLYTDKEFIKKNYKDLSPVVQRAIKDYTRKSKLLTTEDL